MASDLELDLGLEPRQCQVCRTRAGLQRCSGCKAVFYCSREHQTSHRGSHKRACTQVRKALANLALEERKLRSMRLGGFLADTDLFEEHVGNFWAISDTRNYMRARYAVVLYMIAQFDNTDAIQASLDHLTEMLYLCRSDNQGVRDLMPGLYLRLGQDQECYDFVKRWATLARVEPDEDDWGFLCERDLGVHDADVFESPEGLWAGGCLQLSPAVCLVLIKVRILLDLQRMQNATRAFQGALPREIIDEIRGRALVSSVVASRRDIVLASAERTAELVMLVKGQIRMLFYAIASYSPAFWGLLLYPPRGSEGIPDADKYPPGSADEAAVMVMYNCQAWGETPGSIQVIKKLMNVP